MSRAMLGLRLLVALSGAVLLGMAASVLGVGPIGIVTLLAALAGVVLATRRPDGPGAMVALLALALWWWGSGAGTPWWQTGTVGLLALAFHQVCAWATLGPLHTSLSARTGRHLLVRAGVLLLASVLALGVVVAAWSSTVAPSGYWAAGAVVVLVGVAFALTQRRNAVEEGGREPRADEAARRLG